MVAIVTVDLPRGVSNTNFIAANYPSDFPDDQEMQWNFAVPGMHNYTVDFSDGTAPECLRNEVEVEYHREKKKKVAKLTLEDRSTISLRLRGVDTTERTLHTYPTKARVTLSLSF